MRKLVVTLLGVVMLQCFATRAKTRCDVWELYDDIKTCSAKAREYNRLDNRLLTGTGVPLIVHYTCHYEPPAP